MWRRALRVDAGRHNRATYGHAKFEELVPLFFEELAEGGTTDDVLSELGWEKQERKKAWLPPKVLNTQSIGVRLPAFA